MNGVERGEPFGKRMNSACRVGNNNMFERGPQKLNVSLTMKEGKVNIQQVVAHARVVGWRKSFDWN